MEDPKKLYVVPVPGGLVRFPNSKERLPDEGGWVPNDQYWNRRVMHKDVVLGTPPNEISKVEEQIEEVKTEKKRSHRRDITRDEGES